MTNSLSRKLCPSCVKLDPNMLLECKGNFVIDYMPFPCTYMRACVGVRVPVCRVLHAPLLAQTLSLR